MRQGIQTWLHSVVHYPRWRLVLFGVAVGVLLVSLTPLEDLSYDLSFSYRPGVSITNAVLVLADQETLYELGSDHGELSRTNHARLIDRLTKEGAALIFYDYAFTESNQVAEVDRSLAQAIARQGSVVLVAGAESSVEHGSISTEQLFRPIRVLAKGAKGWGHAELLDNVVRQISPDFAYARYAVWLAVAQFAPERTAGKDPNLERWLNYYGGPDSTAIPRCSYQDVLATNVAPGFFAKKAVFAGQSFRSGKMASFKDTFATPFSRCGQEPMPGVEIHATAFLNLLRDDWLRRLPRTWQWLVAIWWGVLIVTVLHELSRMPIAVLILTALAGAVFLCLISLYVQWTTHWWWSWVGPAFGQTAFALALVLARPKTKTDPFLAFISYRSDSDSTAASDIAKELQKKGCKTFIDEEGLELGRFDTQLEQCLEQCTFLILILSAESLDPRKDHNDWVLWELHHALFGSALFSVHDFVDLRSLAKKLKQGKGPISPWLTAQMCDRAKSALEHYNDSDSDQCHLKDLLVQLLNNIVTGPSIYDAQRFAGIALDKETQDLLAKNPEGQALHHLNRLLLADAYRHELSRAPRLPRKTVIPIFKDGFVFKTQENIPDPPEIAKLKLLHGVHYSSSLSASNDFIKELCSLMKKDLQRRAEVDGPTLKSPVKG
jgi:CHASE2 domain-containing sensor protein